MIKKLLIVSNNPSRASFRQRIGDYIPYLHERGIQAEVQKLPMRLLQRWRLFRRASLFDGVLIHKKCLNYMDSKILRRSSRKILYDFDDAVMYSPERPESKHTSHGRLFRRTAQMADLVIAGNEYLAEHAGRFCPKVEILPTGLDTQAFRTLQKTTRDERIRLVWIGSKSTLKYLAEIRPVLEQIGKENPEITLRIISDAFLDLRNMKVEKCVWSLDRQNQDLMDADIGLAPLPDNRFSRGKCGFKILQYFAAGLPAVASGIGVNRGFIENSQAGLIANTPEQWLGAIKQLIQSEESVRVMSRRGKEFVRQYDIQQIGRKFADLLYAFISS